MSIRRHFIFQSAAFNTSEPKHDYINENCFGDDVARWLGERLKSRGVQVEPEPGQEDFGWYISLRIGKTDYDLVIAHRPGNEGQLGDWMCTLERKAGLFASIFGARKRGIQPEALEALHGVLSTSPEISNLLWFTDEGFHREENGRKTPTEG
jgi:hypothetical protein